MLLATINDWLYRCIWCAAHTYTHTHIILVPVRPSGNDFYKGGNGRDQGSLATLATLAQQSKMANAGTTNSVRGKRWWTGEICSEPLSFCLEACLFCPILFRRLSSSWAEGLSDPSVDLQVKWRY